MVRGCRCAQPPGYVLASLRDAPDLANHAYPSTDLKMKTDTQIRRLMLTQLNPRLLRDFSGAPRTKLKETNPGHEQARVPASQPLALTPTLSPRRGRIIRCLGEGLNQDSSPALPQDRTHPNASPLPGDHDARSARLLSGNCIVAGFGSHWTQVRASLIAAKPPFPSRLGLALTFFFAALALGQLLALADFAQTLALLALGAWMFFSTSHFIVHR